MCSKKEIETSEVDWSRVGVDWRQSVSSLLPLSTFSVIFWILTHYLDLSFWEVVSLLRIHHRKQILVLWNIHTYWFRLDFIFNFLDVLFLQLLVYTSPDKYYPKWHYQGHQSFLIDWRLPIYQRNFLFFCDKNIAWQTSFSISLSFLESKNFK